MGEDIGKKMSAEAKKNMKAYNKNKLAANKVFAGILAVNKLSEAQALLFLPPDSKVAKSLADNRWRCQWAAVNRSRAWTLYGEVQSFARCAKYLWHHFTRLSGIECPFQFILDAPLDDGN